MRFPLKYLAYVDPNLVQLNVGSRVIAANNTVYLLAPKYSNQYRYLVFFDDGSAQYCTHEKVRGLFNKLYFIR